MCCDGILYHKAVTKGPFYQKRGEKGKGKRQPPHLKPYLLN